MKKTLCCILLCIICMGAAILKISNETLKASRYINKNSHIKITGSIKPLSISFETYRYNYTFNLYSKDNIKSNTTYIMNFFKNLKNNKSIKNKI